MKKILKIIGVLIVIILLFLIAAPFLFKGSLEKLLKKNINQNLNATVEWREMDLSLFKSFPDAAVVINDFSVVNKSPFEGDTLAKGKTIKLDMGVMQLLKSSDEPIIVDALQLDDAFINIKVDSLGNANYDIAIKEDAPITQSKTEATSSNEGFTFNLQHYEINDSQINYLDEATKTFLTLKDVNHEGTGDFSLDVSELKTQTNALVSLKIEDIEYLSENTVSLDAVFNMDLKNQKYTFLDNEAKINELPLTFDGFFKVNETHNEIDLTFKTPSSDFKNFLAVIPKEYVKDINNVTTTGNFSVQGMLKGKIDETYIPTMDISVQSDNASFKYPDLPKAVENIHIDAVLKNETGLIKDTYLNIGGLTFKIDNETFTANGSIKNLTENALVNMALKGTINLANIEKILPVEMEQNLTGVFKADITTNFDMQSIEKEQYQNIKSSGTASISGFNYNDAAFKNELKISNASTTFSPGVIKLTSFKASTGNTDVSATGTMQNLIPWVMAKQDLKGSFNVQSNTFNVNDFMTSETGEKTKSSSEENNKSQNSTVKEAIKIPDFLDATLNFSANTVLYDNLNLTNVKGTATIKDETATLSNVTSNIFGGNIALGGNVSTKNTTPTFAMNLDLSKIDIDESFKNLELLQFLAPIAKALQGNLSTKIDLNGELTNDLTPKISTLAGNAVAQILTAEVDKQELPLLSRLGEKVSFLNIDRLSLRDVSTVLKFNNGNIEVQPFDFDVKGINVAVRGNHGLDKSINYNATLDVPGKYLGGDVSNLLAKLDPENAQNVTVNVPVNINGTLNNPSISVDTKSAVSELTQRLIEKQKQELKDKGTDILGDILGGGNKKDSTDTQQNTTTVVKDILGGIFGGKKKDTTNNGG
ncbi:AsmA family protein [Marixanthomonas sp. SCSIO 43207]|uniref:AsmA-like C-terminal region-containing protein n=1 Tax=Marixanthomonas sp. SCSIO 43207 TaxID=2779360 RepID=UPI001CA9A0F5|nr:AsmA-like C-terminal region-containing protein [Marixanthomonas sp. SCSIO 43207]UAB81624.1 AsmA family protein [Marixanthomonas sp. SCSIO 43207]